MSNKQELTVDRLKEESDKSNPYFTKDEIEFLSQYAPTHFSDKSLETLLSNSHAQIEINQKVFDVIVKLDISVARNAKLDVLLKEKGYLLNPVFSVFGLPEVSFEGDVYHSLHTLKHNGLEILQATSPKPDEIIQRNYESNGLFSAERDQLLRIFGDVPMIIYGSSLTKANPSDIDSVVFPDGLDPEIYRKIEGKYQADRIPPLSFVVTPLEYLTAFAMSETRGNFKPENSRVINGDINVPIMDEAYLENLKVHQVVSEYMRVRESLTENGLQSCEKILPRINAYLKKPKFMYSHLGMENKLPEPTIEIFDALPNRTELISALARTNIECHKLLTTYLKDR